MGLGQCLYRTLRLGQCPFLYQTVGLGCPSGLLLPFPNPHRFAPVLQQVQQGSSRGLLVPQLSLAQGEVAMWGGTAAPHPIFCLHVFIASSSFIRYFLSPSHVISVHKTCSECVVPFGGWLFGQAVLTGPELRTGLCHASSVAQLSVQLHLRYLIISQDQRDQSYSTVKTTSPAVTVNNLKPGTLYIFQIRTSSSPDYGDYNPGIEVETLAECKCSSSRVLSGL